MVILIIGAVKSIPGLFANDDGYAAVAPLGMAGRIMQLTLNTFGTLLLQTGIVVIMFSMGLQVTGREIRAAMRRGRLVAVVLLANLLVLPVIAVGVSRLVAMPEFVAAGFIVASVAPGASMSPKLTEIARADLSLAVSLMFVMCLLSVVTTPFMVELLLPNSPNIQFDPAPIFSTLVRFQLIPLLVGLAVHHWRPGLADRLRRPSIRLANWLFFAVVAFYFIRDFDVVLALPLLSLAGMFFMTFISLVVGLNIGGSDKEVRRSVALSTSVEFAGLALLIVSLSFPGTAAAVAVVGFGLIMILINTVVAFAWKQRAVAAREDTAGATQTS